MQIHKKIDGFFEKQWFNRHQYESKYQNKERDQTDINKQKWINYV